jgi:hypothetical protein
VEQPGCWDGTASELLADLAPLAGEKVTKQQTWPKDGRAMSNALRRLAPTLRAVGIQVTMGIRSGKKGSRMIHLKQSAPTTAAGTSQAETPQDTGRVQGTI